MYVPWHPAALSLVADCAIFYHGFAAQRFLRLKGFTLPLYLFQSETAFNTWIQVSEDQTLFDISSCEHPKTTSASAVPLCTRDSASLSLHALAEQQQKQVTRRYASFGRWRSDCFSFVNVGAASDGEVHRLTKAALWLMLPTRPSC